MILIIKLIIIIITIKKKINNDVANSLPSPLLAFLPARSHPLPHTRTHNWQSDIILPRAEEWGDVKNSEAW